MFQLAQLGQVRWPVTFTDPLDENKSATMIVTYQTYTRAELVKMRSEATNGTWGVVNKALQAVQKGGKSMDVESVKALEERLTAEAEKAIGKTAKDDDELVARIIDWQPKDKSKPVFVAEDGTAVACTEQTKRALIVHQPFYEALATGLLEASTKAHAKNSSPGRAGTAAPAQDMKD